MSVDKSKLPAPLNTTDVQLPLTPTKEHHRNARRLAVFCNDSTAPELIRAALLSVLAQASAATQTNVLYDGKDGDELRVSPRDLAFMLLEVDRRGLVFSELGLMDSERNYLLEKKGCTN